MNRAEPASRRRRHLIGGAVVVALTASVGTAVACVPTEAEARENATVRLVAGDQDVTDAAGHTWRAYRGYEGRATLERVDHGRIDFRDPDLIDIVARGVQDVYVPVQAKGTYTVRVLAGPPQADGSGDDPRVPSGKARHKRGRGADPAPTQTAPTEPGDTVPDQGSAAAGRGEPVAVGEPDPHASPATEPGPEPSSEPTTGGGSGAPPSTTPQSQWVFLEGRPMAAPMTSNANAVLEQAYTVQIDDGSLDLQLFAPSGTTFISAVEVAPAEPSSASTATATSSPSSTSSAPAPTPSGAATASDGPSSPVPLPEATKPTPTSTTAPAGTTSQNTTAVPFGPGNPFTTKIPKKVEIDPRTDALTKNLVAQVAERYGGVAGFNAYQYNMSLWVAEPGTKKVDVKWNNCQGKAGADPDYFDGTRIFKGVPVPADAQPATGTDGAMSIWDPTTDQLWDFWVMRKDSQGQWEACHGGRIDHVSQSTGQFPGWYGTSASGLAMAGTAITPAEARSGRIQHALNVGLSYTKAGEHVWPAVRNDGNTPGDLQIPEGTRFRVKRSVNVDALPMSRLGKDIVRAAQEYGVLVVDTSDGVALSAAAGKAEKAKTGVDPWDDLLQGKNPMEGFPWDQVEFLPPGWGAPTTK
ncbi:hypothetical protein [Arsenicicoccus bolidensis]|uniref:hypothetical protein n=1 Tax=Arsenicicoccus bolidensis TaxID=229480 RepID=UPI0028AB2758|nr:hypothetical protein [Arsenicicoccus bolidensis]